MLKWKSKYIDSLIIAGFEIKELPENFGNIKIRGYLNLSRNHLRTLPDEFRNSDRMFFIS